MVIESAAWCRAEQEESMAHRPTFATPTRAHVGLSVTDLDASKRFYTALLGQMPSKERPGYAKFEVADPPLNLSLNRVEAYRPDLGPAGHFGIQVQRSADIARYQQRLEQAGIATRPEKEVACCYAVQDKIWARDPDGYEWEVFEVLDDDAPDRAAGTGACCPDASDRVAAGQACCDPGCC
jgi:catechol 2,3-dioxygenase-like lactoylglutathione lyase family enzyme